MSTIKEIIRSHQAEVYPNGVGSVQRCIKSSDFESLEKEIKSRVFETLMTDLSDEIKKGGHSNKGVMDWINKVM